MSKTDAYLELHDGEIDTLCNARILADSVNSVLEFVDPTEMGIDDDLLCEFLSSWEGAW